MDKMMKKNQGFTLIELMVVVVIVGIVILVALGYIGHTISTDSTVDVTTPSAVLVKDNPNLDNCKPLQDDNRVIYSCPDGSIYTK